MKNKKYVTVNSDHEGLDYRSIADIMTKNGHKMNHSSVRNYIVRSFKKVAKEITQQYGINYDEKQIDELAKSPEFQHGLINIMKRKDFNETN